jgi:hypothetical protein
MSCVENRGLVAAPVVNPNRQAPQSHALPPPVFVHPLCGRSLETRYIVWVAIGRGVAVNRFGSLV